MEKTSPCYPQYLCCSSTISPNASSQSLHYISTISSVSLHYISITSIASYNYVNYGFTVSPLYLHEISLWNPCFYISISTFWWFPLHMDYIQPPAFPAKKQVAREFVLQRMLLNDDERLDSIVSGTSGAPSDTHRRPTRRGQFCGVRAPAACGEQRCCNGAFFSMG